LQDPKPSPVSFATQRYFGVNAFKFVNRAGDETMVRYRIEPVEGVRYVSDADMASKSANYLFDEVPKRLQAGPIEFKLLAQIAAAGDVTDDAQEIWPEERSVVELGRVSIDAVLGEEDSARVQKQVIFDPIPRVEGVEVSGDPLLDVRASLYLISGRQRREAKDEVAVGGGQAEIAKTEAVKAAT
jgi:catalase